MKKIVSLFILIFASGLFAQKPGEWAWMNGVNTPDPTAVYGTTGVPAAGNMPGNKYESLEWTDSTGMFWIYGGWPTPSGSGFAGDLWKYNPNTNQWTFIGGNKTQNFSTPGVYGTKGVASAATKPGNMVAQQSVADRNGKLWILLEGYTNNMMLDPATNQWTWVSGLGSAYGPANFGQKGVSSPANSPGPSSESACAWVDANNNLWAYTYYNKPNKGGNVGLMWKFNTTTNEWTWMAGDTINGSVFGTKGVPGPGVQPGSYWSYCRWVDHDGNFWMFGGQDLGIPSANYDVSTNILWKFDPKINQWAWMGGGPNAGMAGVYGTKGVSAPANWPGARNENRASLWVDKCGNLWMFGGNGTNSNGAVLFNDLWMYCIKKGEWTWKGGSNTGVSFGSGNNAVWGTKGVFAPGNMPGSRCGANTFTDSKGNFWLFGGAQSNGNYNDLWELYTQTLTTKTPTSSCNANDGSATTQVFFGVSPYTYTWTSSLITTTNTATGLAPGAYTVSVTDAAGCIQTDTFTIVSPVGLPVNGSVTHTNPTCGLNNDGTATIVPTGTATPFTYLWDNGSTDATASGLSAGTHNVTVVDQNGCKFQSTVLLTLPKTPIVSILPTSPGCAASPAGTATAYPSDGKSPYTYSWSSGSQTDVTATGLAAGNYTVTVTDANGCTVSKTTTIPSGANSISISTGVTPTGCTKSLGTATASVSGGNSPYTYSWTGGQTSQMATGLAGGSILVTVTDASGCTKSSGTAIPPAKNDLIVSYFPNVNPTCANNDGKLEAIAVLGTSPYTYTWSGSASNQTTASATGLAAGNYTITVTDFAGCKATASFTLSAPSSSLAFNTSVTPAACGSAIGTASANVTAGSTPYTYSWSANASNQTTATATGLSQGVYTVVVGDKSGCTKTKTVSVSASGSPTLVTGSAGSTCSGNDGSATVSSVTGGTAPYSYTWTSTSGVLTQTTQTATGLAAGTYTVNVNDNNNCSATNTIVVTQAGAPVPVMSSLSSGCNASDGSATVSSVTGGSTPYSYSWGTAPAQTTQTATGLAAGVYTVVVTDNVNCSATETVSVGVLNGPTMGTPTSTKASCNDFDGTAAVSGASGGTAPYTYSWVSSSGALTQTTASVTGLAGGQYTVSIIDASGCSYTTTVSIAKDPSITAVVSPDSTIEEGESVVLTATSTASGATYSWSVVGTGTSLSCTSCQSPTAKPETTTSYAVVVTDQQGCTFKDTVTIFIETECTDIYLPTAFSPNGDGVNEMFRPRIEEKCLHDYSLLIFNRWGEMLFQTFEIEKGWTGSYRGQPMNSGVYIYVLRALDQSGEKVERKGNVTLVR